MDIWSTVIYEALSDTIGYRGVSFLFSHGGFFADFWPHLKAHFSHLKSWPPSVSHGHTHSGHVNRGITTLSPPWSSKKDLFSLRGIGLGEFDPETTRLGPNETGSAGCATFTFWMEDVLPVCNSFFDPFFPNTSAGFYGDGLLYFSLISGFDPKFEPKTS